ncbi:MAG: tetratricopeptide repeat protein [Candidatus Dormibacteria bacterium]
MLEWPGGVGGGGFRRIEGSMLLADISGFTALSERLGRIGKIGTEELTHHIDGVFGALLSDSSAFGGSMLKFGGDALLIFFWGDDHGLRSCTAAAVMQAGMRRGGTVRTSAGPVRLRMSVGVHSAPFDFFLVGETHRELVVAGPASTRVAQLQKLARAGEIMVSPETFGTLPRGWLGSHQDEAILLQRPGRRADRAEPPPVAAAEGLSQYIPVALRQQLSAGRLDPEHRQATVGFVRFSGVDEMLAASGPEDTAGALHSLVSMAQRQLEDAGATFLGTDVDAGGGKIIAVAGAPDAHDNNEERLLRALGALMAGDHPLSLQAGVHRGRVFAGDVGPRFRRTYTVMGDVVNTAARLMAQSDPGAMLTTEETLIRSSTTFVTEELPAFIAKGKARLVTPFRVGPVAGRRSGRDGDDLPLTGRAQDLGTLLVAARMAASGQGSVIQVTGEVGMGKSRLLREMAAQAADFKVLWAESSPYDANTPYFVMGQFLRGALGLPPEPTAAQLRGRVRALSPQLLPWLPLIAAPLGIDAGSTEEVQRINPERLADRLDQVIAEVLEIAVPNPTLWLADDVQWADSASVRMLQFLSRDVRRAPWLICLATREADAAVRVAPDAVNVQLGPLGPEHSLALVRAVAGGRFLPDQAEGVANRGAGNPLLLRELASAALRSADAGSLPDSVEALIAAKIDGLPPEDRTLLRVASVFGTRVPPVLAATVADSDGTWERLGDFVIMDRGELRFRQPLFQEVAYEGLSFQRRRRFHEAAAVILEAQTKDPTGLADQLSVHFTAAQRWGEAWRYSRLAAQNASAAFAHADAAVFQRRAIAAARRLRTVPAAELSAAWEELGEATRLTGRLDEARQAYGRARRLADGAAAERLSVLYMREGAVRFRQSRFTAAQRWYRRALRLAGEGGVNPAVVSQLKAYSAQVAYRRGRYAEVLRLTDDVARAAEADQDRSGLAMAYHMRALALQAMGDRAAVDYYDRALPLYEETGDIARGSAIVNDLATNFHGAGRLPEALALFIKNREAFQRLRNVPNAALVSTNVGDVLVDMGRFDEALGYLEEASATLRTAGHYYAINADLVMAKLFARRGEFQRADELLTEAERGLARSGMPAGAAATVRIEALLLAGRGADALQTITQDAELAAQAPAVWWGYALAQAGRLAEASNYFDRAIAEARDAGNAHELATALEARARFDGFAGEAGGPASAEAAEIYAALGVVSIPVYPVSPAS